MLAIYEIDNIQVTNSRLLKLINYSQGDHPTETISSRACCLKPWWNTAMTRYPWVLWWVWESIKLYWTHFLIWMTNMWLIDNMWKIREYFHFLLFLRRDWEAISKLRASGFIRVSKHSKTKKNTRPATLCFHQFWNPDETLALIFEIVSLFFMPQYFLKGNYTYISWNETLKEEGNEQFTG